MTDIVTERRGFFQFLAGAFAAATLPKLPLPSLDYVDTKFIPVVPELNAIVRRTFVPRLVVQQYTQLPMLSLRMHREDAP
jgi:hypothetical protein